MNFDSLFAFVLNLFHQYSILFGVIAVILLFIVYKNLKASFKFVLLLLVLAAFLYGVGLFVDVFKTGSRNTDQMINKTRKLVD